jgi:lysophospholipase L1-like esterase
MRVVIFSDSLGRPRPDIDQRNSTRYEDVYGYIVKEYFQGMHEVDICYIDSLDSQDAVYWSQRMVAFREPDVAIFHLGVNDAAPRLFKKNSRSVLLSPWFRKITRDIFMRILHRYRYSFTKFFPKTYTTPLQFKNNFVEIINEVRKYNPRVCCFGISIGFGAGDLIKRNFGHNENIVKYNGILKIVFDEGYIEINSLMPEGQLLIDDNIHLTKGAHKQLANEIVQRCTKIESLDLCVG